MRRKKFVLFVLFGFILLTTTSCEKIFKVTNKDFEFKVNKVNGVDASRGEEVKLNLDITSNFNYLIESVTVNDNIVKNVFKEDENLVIHTGTLMNSASKDFKVSEITYLNLENEKTGTIETSLNTTVNLKDSVTNYSGCIEINQWRLSKSVYLLNDWKKEKANFNISFSIKEVGDAKVSLTDSFKINGKNYSAIYDEVNRIYRVSDIVNDINPSDLHTFSFNLGGINYTLGDEVNTLEINERKDLHFTDGKFSSESYEVIGAEKVDIYMKNIEQVDDSITLQVKVHNSSGSALMSGKLRTNFGEFGISADKINFINRVDDEFTFETKFSLKEIVGEVGNAPKELNISSFSLFFDANEQESEVMVPMDYRCDVYTKFITNQNELQAIDGQTGSFILLNDISLNLNPFDFENSVIMNLSCYLNGNGKTIARENDCFNSLIANIDENGILADVIYKAAFRINNYTSKFKEGTPKNKFADGEYDENKNYSKSSTLCGTNKGLINKVKVCGSIYTTPTYSEGMPLSYDGIVGLNYGTMKDVQIAFEHINTVNQNPKYDFKEFTFVTYKNYGTINGLIVTKSTGYMLFATNKAIVKNINFYFLSKENYGSIEKVLFLETFVQRIWNGHTANIESSFSPYIDQFFYFPVKEGENASLEDYYYCETLDRDRDEYFGNIYNGRPVYRYWQDNSYKAEGQWYMFFEDKFGADVIESTPGFSDEPLSEDSVRAKKFWTKYLINDYVYGAKDTDGSALFRQDITRLSAIEINTSLYEIVFSKNFYKGKPSWICEEPDNTIMSTLRLQF